MIPAMDGEKTKNKSPITEGENKMPLEQTQNVIDLGHPERLCRLNKHVTHTHLGIEQTRQNSKKTTKTNMPPID